MTYAERAGLGLVVPHDMILDLELWRWAPDSTALYFTRTPTSPRGAPLEQELGKPVVTANQATMWGLLRRVGESLTTTGQRLFDTTLGAGR